MPKAAVRGDNVGLRLRSWPRDSCAFPPRRSVGVRMPGRDDGTHGFRNLGGPATAGGVDSGADSAQHSHVWRRFDENRIFTAGNCTTASANMLRFERPGAVAGTHHSSLRDRNIEPPVEDSATPDRCFDRSTRDRGNSRVAASESKRRKSRARGRHAATGYGECFFRDGLPARWS